jgi:hypothetical protein
MGKFAAIYPAKLVIGFIFREESLFNKALEILKKKFGEIDFQSQAFVFDYTDYYEPEFGKGLKKQFVTFKRSIHPQDLARIKIFTNTLEKKLSLDGKRRVNIDPGYLNLAKLVLASTKDFSHRIYLGKGIFGEITLMFKDKSFRPLDWTYPDFRTKEYIELFNQIRQCYADQLRSASPTS